MTHQASDFPHEIDIVTPAFTADRYLSNSKDWSAATTVTASAFMRQRTSTETTGEREARVSTWLLTAPDDTPITAMDRVVWNERTFEVVGDAVQALDLGTGTYHHIEVQLRIVEG